MRTGLAGRAYIHTLCGIKSPGASVREARRRGKGPRPAPCRRGRHSEPKAAAVRPFRTYWPLPHPTNFVRGDPSPLVAAVAASIASIPGSPERVVCVLGWSGCPLCSWHLQAAAIGTSLHHCTTSCSCCDDCGMVTVRVECAASKRMLAGITTAPFSVTREGLRAKCSSTRLLRCRG